jgi:sulfate adenylyltransferase subunit 2
MIQFRDEFCKKEGLYLLVHIIEEGRKAGISPFSHGSKKHTDIMKTQAFYRH